MIDDTLGRQIARSSGLKVTELLGVLYEATQQNLVDFPKAITALQKTRFRV